MANPDDNTKFYLFAHEAYDARGGLNDYIGVYPTLKSALFILLTRTEELAEIATIDTDNELVQIGDYWKTDYAIEETFLIRGKRSADGVKRWVRVWTEPPPDGMPLFYQYHAEIVTHD